MANALYSLGKQALLTGGINWTSDDIKCVLVDTGTYTVNLTTHQYHSDLSGIVATSANFASKSATLGVADAADITFSGVTGASAEAVVIFKDSGVSGTSPLIAYIDTATGLPVVPNSGDINITWSNGSSRIFAL